MGVGAHGGGWLGGWVEELGGRPDAEGGRMVAIRELSVDQEPKAAHKHSQQEN